MINRFFSSLVSLLFIVYCLYFSGCGYTTRSFVYHRDKIFITPITNRMDITSQERGSTSFPILLEKKLTNVLVDKFNINGHLKVVSKEEDALKLTCFIDNYEKDALRYTDSDEIKEQSLRLYIHMTLTDFTGEILKEEQIVGKTSYFLTGLSQKSETAAWTNLVDDTARRILEAVTEKW